MKNLKNNARREWMKKGVLGLALMPIIGSELISCRARPEEESEESNSSVPMRILILGGTSFLGPHQIAYALSRGHSISIFTRGKTVPNIYPELFDQVEQLIGDRNDNLTALDTGEWDVVIDNSGHNAEWTKKTAELLKDRVGIYLYTSSTGVYYPYLGESIDEDTELLLEEPTEVVDEDMKLEYWYGVMKSNSELEAIKSFGKDRSIIVRPTYMMGPGDGTDRFIHWPIRLSKGGSILVPGRQNDPVQYIDVRDVAEWMIRLAEQKKAGIFNAAGPSTMQTILDFVSQAQEAFNVESKLILVDNYDFLKENNIPYLVPWIPVEGNNYGSARADNSRAIASGLTFRRIQESVKDIYNWWYSDALSDERRAQVEKNPESVLVREKELLALWRIRNK